MAHSLSPRMQNAAFAARGLDWVYVALDVPPERLEEAVRGLDALGFAGANVTAPNISAISTASFMAKTPAKVLPAAGISCIPNSGLRSSRRRASRSIIRRKRYSASKKAETKLCASM